MKIVAEADDGPVLGIHMIGPHVTDLIAEAMLITNWEAAAAEVAALIHPHPSLSEGIGEAHLALAGKSLHTAVRSDRGDEVDRDRRPSRRSGGRCPTTELPRAAAHAEARAATSTSAWRPCTARAACRARSTPAGGRRARTSAA